MRAIYMSLPLEFDNDGDGKKVRTICTWVIESRNCLCGVI